MPLPALALTASALRIGLVAYAGYSLYRQIGRAPADFRAEAAMDDLQEGMALRKGNDAVNGSYRWKRTIRLGENGPGLELDASLLGRFRVRRLFQGP